MSYRKLLPFPELRERGVLHGRRQVDRLEAEGKFPKRVSVGTNRVGWVATEIDDWVNAAISARSQQPDSQSLQAGRGNRGDEHSAATSASI
jgi:prophage regulatory protein